MIDPALLDHLDEDELRFVPRAGSFDTELIRRHLATVGHSFQDAAEPSMMVIASSAEECDMLQKRRRAAPHDGFPYVLLVELEPDAITVYPAGDGAYAQLSADVILWLLATYPCRVFNDNDVEITDELAPFSAPGG